ncbi:UNVERIFIED_CONTAM: hypothetical protein FKN15_011565 [Acipenser sinensis]
MQSEAAGEQTVLTQFNCCSERIHITLFDSGLPYARIVNFCRYQVAPVDDKLETMLGRIY